MTTPFQSNPATTGSDSRLSSNRWPALPVVEWETTRDTLQLWTRIIGKVHMVDEPRVNHWWNVPLYVTAQGLSTSLISHPSGQGFQIDFDLRAHQLVIVTSAGSRRALALRSGPVADFYAKVMRRVIAHLASTLLC